MVGAIVMLKSCHSACLHGKIQFPQAFKLTRSLASLTRRNSSSAAGPLLNVSRLLLPHHTHLKPPSSSTSRQAYPSESPPSTTVDRPFTKHPSGTSLTSS